MRLLLLLHDHPANPRLGGGGALRMRHLSRHLIGKGHQVHWVAGWFPGCEEVPAEPGLRMTFLGRTPKFRTAVYAWAAARRVHEFAREADIAVEEFSPYSPLFSNRLRSIPVVLQVQNQIGRRLLVRHPLAGAPLWLVETAYPHLFRNKIVVGESLRQLRYPDAEVIPMGVPAGAFSVEPETGSYIAFLGRLDFDQKGIDLLLKAAASTGLPVKIAGKGPDLARLRLQLPSLPNVEYLGQLGESEKFEFLARSRFAVLPSRFEGEPISLVETAACGKACLVSDIPQNRFAVEQGFGIAFPSGDAPALAREMAGLWASSDLPALGSRGRAFARGRSWPAIGDHLEAYLTERIAEAKPSSLS